MRLGGQVLTRGKGFVEIRLAFQKHPLGTVAESLHQQLDAKLKAAAFVQIIAAEPLGILGGRLLGLAVAGIQPAAELLEMAFGVAAGVVDQPFISGLGIICGPPL